MANIPDEIKTELLADLKAAGFSDYDRFVAWLEDQGYAVSRSAFGRWAKQQHHHIIKMQGVVELARTISDLFQADGCSLSDATNKILQVEILQAAQTWETTDYKAIGALANLAKAQASISTAAQASEDWKAEYAANLAAKLKAHLPKSSISPEVQQAIDDLYGWDRNITKESMAPLTPLAIELPTSNQPEN